MAIEEQTTEEIKQTMYLAVVGKGWEKAFSVYAAVIGAAGHSRSGEFVVYKLEGTPAELAQTYVDPFGRFTYPKSLDIERDYAKGTVSVDTDWDDDDYEKTTYIVRMYIGEE